MTTATPTDPTNATSETSLQTAPQPSSPVFVPRSDIFEAGDVIYLVAEMPGVDEQSVDITLDKNVLTLNGRYVLPRSDDVCEIAEYELGDFQRSFTLSNVIDRAGIKAAMKDGILRLELPKAQEARARKIQVQSV